MAYAALKTAWPHHREKAAHKEDAKKPRRIMPRHKHHAMPPIHVQPIRPINRMTAKMWKDYRIFMAACLLKEWRRKWAAYLPC